MAIQPNYHWQFNEREGFIAKDTIGGVESRFHKVSFEGHGRIGHGVKLSALDSRMTLHGMTERFGTRDFTIAFGIKILNVFKQNDTDIIGNRNVGGHGNWFSLCLQHQGKNLTFEVDENSKGKNYACAKTEQLPNLVDKKWHHVALVRQGKTLKIYFDGSLVKTGTSKTGVANITSKVEIKLGHHTRHTPAAQYEDLRIYHTALSDAEIQALIPPVNPSLRQGEIELVASDNAAVILSQNVDDLSHFSSSFKQLRVGNNTGVTLYQQNDFKGTAQKCYADLPDIRHSRLRNFPKSIRIWSTVGEPFTGKWIIKAPNGRFLSLGKTRLVTTSKQGSNGLFKFHYNLQQDRLQLIPGSDQANALFTLSAVEAPASLLVDDSDSLPGEFSLIDQAKNEWLELIGGNTFRWTQQKENRAVFVRAVKFADNEGQVGELAPGEVALYEHAAYHGKTWILSDSAKVASGEHKRLVDFQGLNDQVSSIRLGPDTGATLFKHSNYQVAEDKREEEIEDILKNVPWLGESQIGNDALSSVKIFRTIEPENVFSSYTTKLSQDYRMVGDNLVEFSAYRTTLRFKPGAGEIEVSATDLTQIEVEGTTYNIDEERSVTLSPNELSFIMITSEADGIDTPGLKIRTSEMALNEQVVIFPNREAHQQIAELEDGALWNAKDAKGNLIVDRNAHTQAEVASAQNTIKRVMATVAYGEDTPTAKNRVQSANRVVSGATIDKPWELTLGATGGNTAALRADGKQSVVAKPLITERQVSSDEWQQLLAQATPAEAEESPEAGTPESSGVISPFPVKFLSLRIGRPFRRLRDAIKNAASVVIGKVKDVVHVIVKTVEGVIDFVVDTVEKVVDFVEGVVETVVESIKQFIEFLQFLFDWEDILETQKYLVKAINDGFDFAAQQVDALKVPVSNFVEDLQDTVEEGLNQLVETLGGDPSEVQKSDFELPEVVEWFFSKLLGGSKQDDAEPAPKLSAQLNEDSQLGNFLFHFTEAFEDTTGAVLRGFEGLGEAIAALISNPLKPQLAVIVLVETLRDVVIQMLDAVKNLVLGFLDAIAEAVKQLKNLLNAEIKIPFISDLFKLIGAGKLTALNLASLLLAIPTTVVSKLVFGEAPFKNEPPLDFTSPATAQAIAPPVAALRSVNAVGEDAIAQAVAEPQISIRETNSARRKSIQHWGTTGLFADVINGLITAVLDATPEGAADKPNEQTAGFGFEVVSLVLSGYSWLASFPSSPDFPGGRPYNLLAHKVSKTENEQEYWERVMWGWRSALYWLDTVVFMAKGAAKLAGNKEVKLQRMRRADAGTIGFTFACSVVDAGLASRYLATIPKADKPGLEIANEVVSWLPNLLCPMRLAGPKGAIALSAVDFVAAFANFGMGHALLNNDLAEL